MKSLWKKRIQPFIEKRFPRIEETRKDWIDNYPQQLELAGPRKFEESVQGLGIRPPLNEKEIFFVSKYINDQKKHNGRDVTDEDILKHILHFAKDAHPLKFVIDGKHNFKKGLRLNLMEEKDAIDPQKIFSGPEHFRELVINIRQDIIVITGAHIHKLIIDTPVLDYLEIHNCCINNIIFSSISQDPPASSMKISDSWIGRLYIGSKYIKDLNVERAWILAINCPAADNENPFTGSVKFRKVKMPTSEEMSLVYKETGTQQYRNLKAHFENLQNGPMAGLMRAKELASERENLHSKLTVYFSWLYFLISDYGQKPERAFKWFFGLLILNIFILFLTDGVVVASGNSGAWQSGWSGDDLWSQFVRAVVLTFQTAINPFTIFLTKSAMQLKSLFGFVHTLLLIFLAVAAFIFGSLGIRKQMKIK